MERLETKLKGLQLFKPKRFEDDRGYFEEYWKPSTYSGLPTFLQSNTSYSSKGVLRGLHFQNPSAQAKLVKVVTGSILDVAVDLRKSSPTFGKWEAFEMSEKNRLQLFIPSGFAHGFMALEDETRVNYLCDKEYAPGGEYTLIWNDPQLNIQWPKLSPIISDKDQTGLQFSELTSHFFE